MDGLWLANYSKALPLAYDWAIDQHTTDFETAIGEDKARDSVVDLSS